METQTVTLESLRRLTELKPPIVGIPRPGERPFAFERRILAQLIEGLDGDTRVFLQEGELTPRLLIESASARRNYKLIGRDMTYYGSNNGAGSLQRNWAQSERARITGMRTVRTPYGERTITVTPKAKVSSRVPAFMYRDLRQAEKHLYPPPKAEREKLFAWLHPSAEIRRYGYDGFNPDPESLRPLALASYRAKANRKALAQITAAYLQGRLVPNLAPPADLAVCPRCRSKRGKGEYGEAGLCDKCYAAVPYPELKRKWRKRWSRMNGWDTATNRLFEIYKAVKALGYSVTTFSKLDKSARERGETEYVKHLHRYVLPQVASLPLRPWLAQGEQFESPVTRHNDAWKECRGAREHVERLRADIKALEAGEVVNFEGQQDEEAQN